MNSSKTWTPIKRVKQTVPCVPDNSSWTCQSCLYKVCHLHARPLALFASDNTTHQFSRMAPSVPNATGSDAPDKVPYGAWDSFPWAPFPMYNGTKSVYYRSKDNKVAIGAIREIGKDTLTWPEDEFLFVTEGWIKFTVHGGDSFTLNKGDVLVLKKGQTFSFEMSDDFANVAVFMSETGVSIV